MRCGLLPGVIMKSALDLISGFRRIRQLLKPLADPDMLSCSTECFYILHIVLDIRAIVFKAQRTKIFCSNVDCKDAYYA